MINKIKTNIIEGRKSNIIAFSIALVSISGYILSAIYPTLPFSKVLIANSGIIGSSLSTIVISLLTLFKN
jgi:hypothetical protein